MGNDLLLKVPVTITSGINEPWDKSEPPTQPQPQPDNQSPSATVTEGKPQPQTHAVQDDPHSDSPVSAIDVRRHSSTHKAPRGKCTNRPIAMLKRLNLTIIRNDR